MSNKRWNRLADSVPNEGELVDWISPYGNEVTGGKKAPGNQWFLPPCHNMCCLYEPVFWRRSDES